MTIAEAGVEAEALAVTRLVSWRDFLKLRVPWNAAAEGDPDACLLGHDWMAQSWKSVAGENRRALPEVLEMRDAAGAWVGAAALELEASGLRRLAFLGDRRAQRLDLLLAPGVAPEAAIAGFGAHLAGRSDWDICDLNHLRRPSAEAILGLWPGQGLAVRERGEVRQRVIRLDREWEAVEASFHPYLRTNFGRREKRLRRLGRLEFVAWSEQRGLVARLEECFRLEASGWKGARGTSILAHAGLHRFYRQLAFRLAAQDRFRLFALLLEGRIVAFEYCLVGGGMGSLSALKIGFDERYRAASPGLVLRRQLLEAVHGTVARYEFLGDDAPWKAEWTGETVRLSHLRVYNRTPLGQAMRWRSRLWQTVRGRIGKPDRPERVLDAPPSAGLPYGLRLSAAGNITFPDGARSARGASKLPRNGAEADHSSSGA